MVEMGDMNVKLFFKTCMNIMVIYGHKGNLPCYPACSWELYEFARAAVMKNHRLSGVNNRN